MKHIATRLLRYFGVIISSDYDFKSKLRLINCENIVLIQFTNILSKQVMTRFEMI